MTSDTPGNASKRAHLLQSGSLGTDDGFGSDFGLGSSWNFGGPPPVVGLPAGPVVAVHPHGTTTYSVTAGSSATGSAPAASSDIVNTAATAPSGTTSLAVVSTQSVASSPFVINALWDTSIQQLGTTNPTLQAEIENEVSAAIQFYESEFTNAMTVDIQFGWGSFDNGFYNVPTNAAGSSVPNAGYYTYSAVRAALAARASSGGATADEIAAFNALPTSSSKTIFLTEGQAKALGLVSPGGNAHSPDGYVGLSSTLNWSFDATSGGTFDAVSVLEHEISEVLGRVGSEGAFYGSGVYTLLDFYRYTQSGSTLIRDTTTTSAVFSIDGTTVQDIVKPNGSTVTATFNAKSSGDLGDWTTSGDSYGVAASNTPSPVSSTDLVLMNAIGYDLACFAVGTRIATTQGEVPIEALRPGDRVRTRFAGTARVKWIGHRQIDCGRHPRPETVRPVRIEAGAFGDGLPKRDLLLSPDHAVCVGDALIPVRLLVNGATIAQAQDTDCVTYFHIELDCHDIVFAEALPAETYLDTGNRGAFANAEPVQLHPEFGDGQAAREAASCLPLLVQQAQVEPVWRALAARAQNLGWTLPAIETTDDPWLRLCVDGRLVQPVSRNAEHCCFVLPRDTGPVRLLSRAVAPNALRPWVEDRRRLGVMVRSIMLHGPGSRIELSVDDPRLHGGWWGCEHDGTTLWRWTDGDAALPVPDGVRQIELRLGTRLAYALRTTPAVPPHPARAVATLPRR